MLHGYATIVFTIYREARAFAYFSVIRLDFVNDALNPANYRFFDFNADLSDWGAGIHYDLSRTFRLNFEITHFFGKNRYTYIDETNVLYATGSQEADFIRACFVDKWKSFKSGRRISGMQTYPLATNSPKKRSTHL